MRLRVAPAQQVTPTAAVPASAADTVVVPGPGASGRKWTRRPIVLRVAAGLGILVVWQVVVGLWAAHYVARPIGVIERFPRVLGDSLFLTDVRTTLLAVLEGLAIAIVIGVLAGLVIGRLPDVQRVVGMYVNGIYAMPIVALVPLITVWFGYTSLTRLVVIVLEATLPVAYNVSEGARVVPATYVDVAKTFRAPWWRMWFGVALPASMPYVLGGIDLAIGRALIGAVVAEFIAAINGLGYYILSNVNSFHENDAVVALLLLALFAIALRSVLNLAIRRVFRWYRPA